MKILGVIILIIPLSICFGDEVDPNLCEFGSTGDKLLSDLTIAVDEVHKYDNDFFKKPDDSLDLNYKTGKSPYELIKIWQEACKTKITPAAHALLNHANKGSQYRGPKLANTPFLFKNRQQFQAMGDWVDFAAVVAQDFINHCKGYENWQEVLKKQVEDLKKDNIPRTYDEQVRIFAGTIRLPIYKTVPHKIRWAINNYYAAFGCGKNIKVQSTPTGVKLEKTPLKTIYTP